MGSKLEHSNLDSGRSDNKAKKMSAAKSMITNSAYSANSEHAFTKSTCNAERPGTHALLWAYESDSNACAEAMPRHTTNSKTTYRMAVASHAADHLVDQQEAYTT